MQHAVWRSAACVYDNRTNVQSAKGEELLLVGGREAGVGACGAPTLGSAWSSNKTARRRSPGARDGAGAWSRCARGRRACTYARPGLPSRGAAHRR